MTDDVFKIESVDGTTYYSHDTDDLPSKTEEWVIGDSLKRVK